MGTELKNYQYLNRFLRRKNIMIFGIADICRHKAAFPDIPSNILNELHYGIIIGMPLSGKVLATLKDKPSLLYLRHYQTTNDLLDRIILSLLAAVQSRGYDGLPIPASEVIDWKRLVSYASHRYIGYLAGIGWIGRSSLLIHPKHKSAVRYASLFTNMPLPAKNTLMPNGCNKCCDCIKICPAKAISKSSDDFKPNQCLKQLTKFAKEIGVSSRVCGLCVRICSL